MNVDRTSATLGKAAWLSVGAGLGGAFFVYLVRYVLSVIVPDLMHSFGIGVTAVGLLGSVYFWAYAPMQVPAGILADTLGPRRSLASFFALAALGSLLFALAPNFGVALLAGALDGLGLSVAYVCAARLIAAWFPPNYFGPLIGGWTAAGSAGALLAGFPFAWLTGEIGWRASLGVIAALLAAYAVVTAFVVRDAPVAARSRHRPARTPLRDAFREIGRRRNTWLLGFYAFFIFGTMIAIQGLWGISYLIDVYRLSRSHASAIVSMWAVGLMLGAPSIGILADRVLHARKPVVLYGTLAYAGVWLILSLRPIGLPEPLLWAVFLMGGLTSASWTASIAQYKDSVSPRIVGTALGVYNLWFFAGPAVLQPVSGVILGLFPRADGGLSVAAFQALFRSGLVAIAAGGLFALFSREQAPK